MKIRRYKRVHRILTFYRNNYNFYPPFKILVDGTFCLAALEQKINVREQLGKYLDEEVSLFTSPCALRELESLGGRVYGALLIAKQSTIHECCHSPPKSAADCFVSLVHRSIKKKRPYFVATKDRELTERLRKIAGCPVLFVNYQTVLLELPSEKSKKKAESTVDKRINFAGAQKDALSSLKKSVLGETGQEAKPKRKRKGIKGPNPLSCKKKKAKSERAPAESEITKKSRRRKKRKIVTDNE